MIMNREQFELQAKLTASLLSLILNDDSIADGSNETIHFNRDKRKGLHGEEDHSSHDNNESFGDMDQEFLSLDAWIVQSKTDEALQNEVLYLKHPFVLRSWIERTNPGYTQVRKENEIMTMTEEEQNDLEDDCAMDMKRHSNNRRIFTEWQFSIVYHDIWCVPVLYFQVTFLDGRRCSRSDVLEALNTISRKTIDESRNIDDHFSELGVVDTWDFLSEEEHPITGIPSFFLHPCQTSARLELMLKALQTTTDDDDDDLVSSGRRHNEPDYLLLMWMTMIFPAVRCKLGMKTLAFLRANYKSDL